jgi:TonB family protein
MRGNRQCIRCGRNIDAQARICPYCNWDQTQPVPAQQPAEVAQVLVYVPPPERRWRMPVLGAAGIVCVILIAAFGLAQRLRETGPDGALPSAQQQEQQKLQQKEEEAAKTAARPRQQANVTLVPDDGPAPSPDQPITSAPATTTAQGLANEYQRTDATAASSAQYSQMAQRAQSEKKKMAVLVDPRSLSGTAYYHGAPRRNTAAARPQDPAGATASNQAAVAPVPNPAPQQVARTNPVPEYQPVPDLRVSRGATVRLDLTIGSDGRVKSVNVSQPVGDMGKLVGVVRSWRFKPATENGVPVQAAFSVDLSFHANE